MASENLNKDLDQLKIAMDNFGAGKYDLLNPDDFSDPSVADSYNQMVKSIILRNNHYLARINDAQIRIGDTSCLKEMFELIVTQEDVLKFLQGASSSSDSDTDTTLAEKNIEFLALSEQIFNTFNYFIDEATEEANKIDELNKSGILKNSLVPARVRETILELQESILNNTDRIQSMSRRLETMTDNTRRVHKVLEEKSELNEKLMASIKALTDGYKALSGECLDTGRHLYRISRDIDTCRNDMFRNNAEPSLHDRLKIYEVDHITLAWRLYNNIVEFESLRLTQVNNPSGCKFGIWVDNMTDPLFLESDAFKRAVNLHKEFHKLSVECFEAKQAYDISVAMQKFNDVLFILSEFRSAFEDLHEHLRQNGITEETDVWKFRR